MELGMVLRIELGMELRMELRLYGTRSGLKDETWDRVLCVRRRRWVRVSYRRWVSLRRGVRVLLKRRVRINLGDCGRKLMFLIPF